MTFFCFVFKKSIFRRLSIASSVDSKAATGRASTGIAEREREVLVLLEIPPGGGLPDKTKETCRDFRRANLRGRGCEKWTATGQRIVVHLDQGRL